ncbi:hypothetical protein ACFQV8_17745 [Pseudonocardia benzenivorans]
MPTVVPLPQDPDVDQLRRQARELSRAARAGDATARARVARWAPEHADGDVPLHVAQLVLARTHGFAGWPPLVRHLRTVARWSWVPPADPADSADPADPAAASPADEFLALACLRYDGDDPVRRERAAALLAARPRSPGRPCTRRRRPPTSTPCAGSSRRTRPVPASTAARTGGRR